MLRSENAALRARIRELVHERDAAVLGAWGQAALCDGSDCAACVGVHPATADEAAVVTALRALGWTVTERRHLCPRCGAA